MMRNEDSKVLRILTDQAHDPPRGSSGTSVAMNEEIYSILGEFFPAFQMVVDYSKCIVADLDFVIRTRGGDVRN